MSGGSIAKKATPEFDAAWNHHLNFNDHHWQFWVRLGDDGAILAAIGQILYGNPVNQRWLDRMTDSFKRRAK